MNNEVSTSRRLCHKATQKGHAKALNIQRFHYLIQNEIFTYNPSGHTAWENAVNCMETGSCQWLVKKSMVYIVETTYDSMQNQISEHPPNSFKPDTVTVHTYPVNSTANPEKKISPLSRVEKNKSATNPITCGRVNPDIFESDDVKRVSSLSPNHIPIWRLTWKHLLICVWQVFKFQPISARLAKSFRGPFIRERFAKRKVHMRLNGFYRVWYDVYFVSLVENFAILQAGL